jgi:hypothetical protein
MHEREPAFTDLAFTSIVGSGSPASCRSTELSACASPGISRSSGETRRSLGEGG